MRHSKYKLKPLEAALRRVLRGAGLAGLAAPALALAGPTGGQVVGGQATITTPNSNTTIINQSSQNAIINWQQFNIGSGEYVQFMQPDSSAIILNRVVGGSASTILGNLSANGQVFLVNPNGVFFGQGATLDVQGLVATTLDIKDSDFMAGRYVFTKSANAPDGQVVNQGTLSAAAGGYIVLAGDYAANAGVISAHTGHVALASGSQMTLTFANNNLVSFAVNQATLEQYAGVLNSGSINADGGGVLMTADVANALTATAVNNTGLISARSIQGHAGAIVLSAQGGNISESGTLDASAAQSGIAGGTVLLRGNGQTDVTSSAVINTQGDGAKGGFVELSGETLRLRGQVETGAGGMLLIDPTILTIGVGSAGPGGNSSNATVGEGYIASQLNKGANVGLVASGTITGTNVNITATGTGNLTLETGTIPVASASKCVFGVCVPNQPTITHTAGTINLTGSTINIKGGFDASASAGNVTLGTVTAKSVAARGGNITTGALTATGGSVNLFAVGNPGFGSTKLITGNITANGNVSLQASHAAAYGGSINVGNISAKTAFMRVTAGSSAGVKAVVKAGTITLFNPSNAAALTISAAGGTKDSINVGAISASGKFAGGSFPCSDCGPPAKLGASVSLTTSGTGAGTIKVNGGVTVSGAGAHYTHKLFGGGQSSGTSGKALLTISDNNTGANSVQVTGNISVQGVGEAAAIIHANRVTVQNISVNATGAPLNIIGGGGSSGSLLKVTKGKETLGKALIQIRGAGSTGAPNATAVSVNTLSVKGVGLGSIGIRGNTINVGGSITGTVGRGTIHGSNVGTFASGAANYNVARTLNGSVGVMKVSLNGSPTGGGAVTVTGGINLKGTASLFSASASHVTVHGISATGSNAAAPLTISETYTHTGTAGSNFQRLLSGPVIATGAVLHGAASLNVLGNVNIQGPGLALFNATANRVAVSGNISVGASSMTLDYVDTRKGRAVNTGSFKGGDVVINLADVTTGPVTAPTPPVFTPASIGGNITVNAARNADLHIDGSTPGYLNVRAGGNVDTGFPSSMAMLIASNPASVFKPPVLAPLNLSVNALSIAAGGNIALAGTNLSVGNGTVPGVGGDPQLLAALQVLGLAPPGVTAPNASFVAGNQLSLGALNFKGNYLYLQANAFNISGPITDPGALVQITPFTPTNTVGIENGPSNGADTNISYQGLLSFFPGDTLVIGGTGQLGTVTMGVNGPINLSPGTNLIIDVQGAVAGLGSVASTGLVATLQSLLFTPNLLPTTGEIDPSAHSTNNGNDRFNNPFNVLLGENNGGQITYSNTLNGMCRP